MRSHKKFDLKSKEYLNKFTVNSLHMPTKILDVSFVFGLSGPLSYQVNVTQEHYLHCLLIRFWTIELLPRNGKHIPRPPCFSSSTPMHIFLPLRWKVRPSNVYISQQEPFKHVVNVFIFRRDLELRKWLVVTLVYRFIPQKISNFLCIFTSNGISYDTMSIGDKPSNLL